MPFGHADCGTMPGWRRHCALGTEPCMPCLVARSNWDRDRKLAATRRRVLLEALAGFDKYPTGRRGAA